MSSTSFQGYEISPKAFALSESIKNNRIKFYLKDFFMEETPYFDVVMAIYVMEHVEDYFGFLRKLNTKGNYKILHIPLDISVQTVFRRKALLRTRELVGHLHYFTKETALATLRDCNYQILDYSYTNGAAELTTHSLKRKLAKIPRKLLFSINKDISALLFGGCSLLVLAK